MIENIGKAYLPYGKHWPATGKRRLQRAEKTWKICPDLVAHERLQYMKPREGLGNDDGNIH